MVIKYLYRVLVIAITKNDFWLLLFIISVLASPSVLAQNDTSYASLDNLFAMSIEELMEQTVVTASKEEEEIEDVPSSVIIITKEDIENYGYQSVVEILENTTGFFKHDDYRNIGFGVRGFFSNIYNRSFVLLVNGIEQSSPYQAWNTTNLTTIQVENIEKIEVIKGPMAVMYGNNAFFGAINIITKQTEQNTSKSQVTTAYGANNSYRSNFQTSINEEDFKASISGGFSESQGRNVPFSPILDSVADYNTGNYYKNATTKDFFKGSTKYINSTGSYQNFYFGFSYDLSETNLINDLAPILSDQKNNYIVQTTRFSLGYKNQLSKKLNLDLNAQYHSNNVEQYYQKASITPKIEYGQLNSYSNRLKGEARIKYKFSQRINVMVGTDVSASNARNYIHVPPVFLNQVNEMKEPLMYISAFTQIKYTLSPKVELIGGARIDYQPAYSMQNQYDSPMGDRIYIDYSYSYDKPVLVPRLATIFKINKKNVLKAMIGQATSRSSISENLRLNNDPQVMLTPQKITTSEIHYTYLKSSNFTFNSSVYYSYLNDLIVRTTRFENGAYFSESNNSGVHTTVGTDLQLLLKLNHNWLIDLSCTLQKTEDKKYDKPAAYSPQVLGYLKTVYKLNRNFSVSVIGNYVSSMESFWDDTPSNLNNPNSAPVGRAHETTPGYVNLGANIRVENLFSKGIFLALHAYNLLDTRKYYAPTEINYNYLPNGTYDQGIKVFANLGVKF